MSLLWSKTMNRTIKKKQRKPSPTCQNNPTDSARNPESYRQSRLSLPSISNRFIKGISLFASVFGWVDAGMTVEAALVLPLFLFFFLNLGCALEMIRLHGNLQLALWQAGSKLSVYGYAVDSGETPEDGAEGGDWWQGLAGVAFSATVVKGQVINAAGSAYLNQSPLTGGAGGLQFWESNLFGAGDEIDLVVTYSVSPWIDLMGFSSFRMANRYYAHIWNGYRTPNTSSEAGSRETQTVYVTETGRVYHLSMDCTHLSLSISMVTSAEVGGKRNQAGGKYYPCSKCVSGAMPTRLYITAEGSSYHYSGDCSGLKRTVSSMILEDAVNAGYTPCSRCGR